MLPTSQLFDLLPVDGFTYKTAQGTFLASVVSPPLSLLDGSMPLSIEIAFRLKRDEILLVRRLTLIVSRDELAKDLPGVMRRINEWVFQEPDGEGYFVGELRLSD